MLLHPCSCMDAAMAWPASFKILPLSPRAGAPATYTHYLYHNYPLGPFLHRPSAHSSMLLGSGFFSAFSQHCGAFMHLQDYPSFFEEEKNTCFAVKFLERSCRVAISQLGNSWRFRATHKGGGRVWEVEGAQEGYDAIHPTFQGCHFP